MTRLDYKLVLVIGPILSVATLWAIELGWDHVGPFSRDPLPSALASIPALAGVVWGVSRRPSVGRAVALFVGAAGITVILLVVTILLYWSINGIE